MSERGKERGLGKRVWRRVAREWHYMVKGAGYIADGWVTIFSFGRVVPQRPEIEEILNRSDRDALFGDWAKIAGDFNVVGAAMNTDLTWMLAEVEAAKARGDSVEEMQAAILRKWAAHEWERAGAV